MIVLDASAAIDWLLYPHELFLPQIWRLRNNFSAYDAAYVSLTEDLQATLITRDARLASASRRLISVELF